MLTIKRNTTTKVLFDTIKVGEIFTDGLHNCIYMKMDKVISTESTTTYYNCIRLDDGKPYRFDSFDKVLRVNATLVED